MVTVIQENRLMKNKIKKRLLVGEAFPDPFNFSVNLTFLLTVIFTTYSIDART